MMNSAPPAQSAPAAPQQSDNDAQQTPVICIQMQPDGTYSVYTSDQGPEDGQSTKDIASALVLVKQMLTDPDGDGDDDSAGGPDSDADDQGQAEALFQSGFKGARNQIGS
jgi:hypothetical protein